MAALIGALRVSLSADTAAFQSGMKRAERQAKTSASSIQKSLGLVKAGFAGFISGLSIGAITQGIKASLDYAGSLGEIAQQLGVTTRELQTFRYAVSQNGGSIEQADKALGKFATSISQARSGSEQMRKTFKAVGVELSDLESKSKSDLLGQIADEMKRTGGASANAAAGVKLFGKDFKSIVPTLDQGSAGMNALANAAEELGIILDDQLIQQADEASDKVDQLQTVLKAQIAGAVAQNVDAIVSLADSLVYLVSKIADAIRWWNDFKNALDAQAFDLASKNPFLSDAKRKEGAELAARARGKISDSGVEWNVAGSKVIKDMKSGGTARDLALKMGLKIAEPGGSGSPTQFLGGGGGGGSKRSPKAPRDTSLRDAFQFEEDQRRLDMDILRAKQDLAHDYVERTALSIEMLNLERQSFEAGLKYQVAAKEITQAQADAQRLKFEEVDRLSRQAVLEEEELARQRDYNMLDDKDFDIKMDLLERQAALAETAKERRDVELRILDLAYEEERRRLQRIIDESKDWAEIEAARRDLLALSQKQALDRQGVINSTRGPFDDWMASLPTSAEKMQEAFERLQVEGFEGLIDAALALSEGFDSAKDALLNTLKQFLLGMARAQLQGLLGSILPAGGFNLGSLFGGFGKGPTTSPPIFSPSNPGVGFATGGFTGSIGRNRIAGFVHGEEGVLNTRGLATLGIPNLNALNRGAPLSTVSNDNGVRGGGWHGDMHVYTNDADSFRRSQSQIARQTKRRLGI